MAFSTQKDLLNISFTNVKDTKYIREQCPVYLKSYTSCTDSRAWSMNNKKRAKYLADIIAATIPNIRKIDDEIVDVGNSPNIDNCNENDAKNLELIKKVQSKLKNIEIVTNDSETIVEEVIDKSDLNRVDLDNEENPSQLEKYNNDTKSNFISEDNTEKYENIVSPLKMEINRLKHFERSYANLLTEFENYKNNFKNSLNTNAEQKDKLKFLEDITRERNMLRNQLERMNGIEPKIQKIKDRAREADKLAKVQEQQSIQLRSHLSEKSLSHQLSDEKLNKNLNLTESKKNNTEKFMQSMINGTENYILSKDEINYLKVYADDYKNKYNKLYRDMRAQLLKSITNEQILNSTQDELCKAKYRIKEYESQMDQLLNMITDMDQQYQYDCMIMQNQLKQLKHNENHSFNKKLKEKKRYDDHIYDMFLVMKLTLSQIFKEYENRTSLADEIISSKKLIGNFEKSNLLKDSVTRHAIEPQTEPLHVLLNISEKEKAEQKIELIKLNEEIQGLLQQIKDLRTSATAEKDEHQKPLYENSGSNKSSPTFLQWQHQRTNMLNIIKKLLFYILSIRKNSQNIVNQIKYRYFIIEKVFIVSKTLGCANNIAFRNSLDVLKSISDQQIPYTKEELSNFYKFIITLYPNYFKNCLNKMNILQKSLKKQQSDLIIKNFDLEKKFNDLRKHEEDISFEEKNLKSSVEKFEFDLGLTKSNFEMEKNLNIKKEKEIESLKMQIRDLNNQLEECENKFKNYNNELLGKNTINEDLVIEKVISNEKSNLSKEVVPILEANESTTITEHDLTIPNDNISKKSSKSALVHETNLDNNSHNIEYIKNILTKFAEQLLLQKYQINELNRNLYNIKGSELKLKECLRSIRDGKNKLIELINNREEDEHTLILELDDVLAGNDINKMELPKQINLAGDEKIIQKQDQLAQETLDKPQILPEEIEEQVREDNKNLKVPEINKNLEVIEDNKNLEVIEDNKNLEVIEDNENLQVIEDNKNLEVIEENKNLQVIEDNKNLEVVKDNKNLEVLGDNKNLEVHEYNKNLKETQQETEQQIEPLSINSQQINNRPEFTDKDRLVEELKNQLRKQEENYIEVEQKLFNCLLKLKKLEDQNMGEHPTHKYHSIEADIPNQDYSVQDRPIQDRLIEDRPHLNRPDHDLMDENRSIRDRPDEDGPNQDRAIQDRPIQDHPNHDPTIQDRPDHNRPIRDRPDQIRLDRDRLNRDRLIRDRLSRDRLSHDHLTTDHPTPDRPIPDRPIPDPLIPDRPTPDPPIPDRPAPDRPIQDRPDQNRPDRPNHQISQTYKSIAPNGQGIREFVNTKSSHINLVNIEKLRKSFNSKVLSISMSYQSDLQNMQLAHEAELHDLEANHDKEIELLRGTNKLLQNSIMKIQKYEDFNVLLANSDGKQITDNRKYGKNIYGESQSIPNLNKWTKLHKICKEILRKGIEFLTLKELAYIHYEIYKAAKKLRPASGGDANESSKKYCTCCEKNTSCPFFHLFSTLENSYLNKNIL